MTTISNKRTICDVNITGNNVLLSGTVELDSKNKVIFLNCDIKLAGDANEYVGNCSLVGVNINDKKYIQYRTEASQLTDTIVSEINGGTAEEA